MYANADQALIHEFIKQGMHPMLVDSNPLASALVTMLHKADLQRGVVELEFQPDTLFVQAAGVLQGGAVSAMLDFAMAFATLANVSAGMSCATANINVSYLASAPSGRYRACGWIDRRGRTVAFAQATLERCETHSIVAKASSTLVLRAMKVIGEGHEAQGMQ